MQTPINIHIQISATEESAAKIDWAVEDWLTSGQLNAIGKTFRKTAKFVSDVDALLPTSLLAQEEEEPEPEPEPELEPEIEPDSVEGSTCYPETVDPVMVSDAADSLGWIAPVHDEDDGQTYGTDEEGSGGGEVESIDFEVTPLEDVTVVSDQPNVELIETPVLAPALTADEVARRLAEHRKAEDREQQQVDIERDDYIVLDLVDGKPAWNELHFAWIRERVQRGMTYQEIYDTLDTEASKSQVSAKVHTISRLAGLHVAKAAL